MWIYVPVGLLLVVFPDGRPATRSGRTALIGLPAVAVAFQLLAGVGGAADAVGAVTAPLKVALVVAFHGLLIAASAAVVLRYRQGDLVVRAQLRWLALAGTGLPLTLLLGSFGYFVLGTSIPTPGRHRAGLSCDSDLDCDRRHATPTLRRRRRHHRLRRLRPDGDHGGRRLHRGLCRHRSGARPLLDDRCRGRHCGVGLHARIDAQPGRAKAGALALPGARASAPRHRPAARARPSRNRLTGGGARDAARGDTRPRPHPHVRRCGGRVRSRGQSRGSHRDPGAAGRHPGRPPASQPRGQAPPLTRRGRRRCTPPGDRPTSRRPRHRPRRGRGQPGTHPARRI